MYFICVDMRMHVCVRGASTNRHTHAPPPPTTTGTTFYLLKEGNVKCCQTKADRQVELLKLGPGDYFGEMALLLEEPRHADVVAVGCVCIHV